jgi:hypothetical protein
MLCLRQCILHLCCNIYYSMHCQRTRHGCSYTHMLSCFAWQQHRWVDPLYARRAKIHKAHWQLC